MAKKLLMAVLFAVGISSLIACSSDDGNENNQNKESNGVFEACFNPSDPLIANIYTQNGDTIYVMGEKDDEGMATGLSDVIIKLKNEENATELLFDDSQNIKEIIAVNGVRMLFEWISEESAAVTLIEPNTGEQLNTVVNFGESNEPVVSQSRINLSAQTCRKGNATMTLEPIKPNTDALTTTRADLVGPNNRIGNVYLKNCEVPADAQCWVKVYDYSDGVYDFGKGKYRTTLTCYRVSTGHYQYVIPSTLEHVHHDWSTLGSFVDKVAGILSNICQGSNALGPAGKQILCAQITAALAAGTVTAPVAPFFEAACASSSVALDVYCATLGQSPAGGGPSVAEMLLREINFTWDTPFYLIPVVNVLPNNVVGVGQKCESGSSPRDFDVSWGGKPEIGNFVLEPAAPVARQDYDAIAYLGCMTYGTTVTMDIVGTDNYTNSQTKTFYENTLNYQAILHVPGAASGVKDVCTVTIKSLDGSVKTKKASLVFQ